MVACDGIWDMMTSEAVVNFVRTRLAAGKVLTNICEELLDACLAPDTANGVCLYQGIDLDVVKDAHLKFLNFLSSGPRL